MKPPMTYAEWSDCLDRLIDGTLQTSDLPILDSGKIEWSKGSAERFASRPSRAGTTRPLPELDRETAPRQ